MATQIAATPIIKGTEAKKVYAEANHLPSKKAKDGAKKLSEIFDNITRSHEIRN